MRATGQGESPVIVLVEEETHQREAISDYLARAGFGVLQAESSDEALTILARQESVDGVVTDAHVPGRIDGFELAALIRRKYPAIAVVMTSGHSDQSSGPLPEGTAFISKPNLLESLAPTLQRMIASLDAEPNA